jgi:hypothetical protein
MCLFYLKVIIYLFNIASYRIWKMFLSYYLYVSSMVLEENFMRLLIYLRTEKFNMLK